MRQVQVEFEVLVVDDGSSDPDAALGILGDPRVRVIRHGRQSGVASARNTGIAEARASWVAFLDDDDRWAPAKLRTQLTLAEETGAQWVYAAALNIDQADRVLFLNNPAPPATDGWLGAINPVPGGCSNVIVRTELVRQVGGFDERLALLADWDLWIRLAQRAKPAVARDVLLAYRQHPDNMHVKRVDELAGELDHLARKHLGAPEMALRDLLVWPALPWQAKAYRRAGRRAHAAQLYLRRWRLTRDKRDLTQAIISLVDERALQLVRRYWTRGKHSPPEWLAA